MSSKAAPDQLVPVDTRHFRRTCARFATGITIVTVVDGLGHPHGVTVNSFASVSLEPPLVLVSIDLKNAILGHFISNSWFAINILAEHQEHLSRRFSSAAENRFVDVVWRPGLSGMPLLDGVLAHLECAVVRTFEIGDHTMLIGEVRRAECREGNPLLYFDSSYRSLSEKS
ncbi:MAG TPA: flavin reductase family protein [Bryobacteraceae bacterium]|jgi:flavin reductase (DIM6/NTAB) family NADH-FMN oxidoreductase RutF|nr:flavin reductase family protein [Bryobacteraceae bacterium]